ncbi:MAG: hypothetical protein ACRDI0_04545 [Actinomycetota bacterium]
MIVAVLGTGLWFLLRDSGLLGDGDDTPEFTFTVGRVKGLGKADKGSQPRLRRTAGELAGTLDAMYLAAFVDPNKWEEGTFPEVLEAFGADAADRARQDLDELTLGPAWAEMSRVRPDVGTLDVRFLLGGTGKPFAAVAITRFEATGDLEAGGAVEVAHAGKYLMRPEEGRWVIIGYQVDGRLKARRAAAAGG